jgi:hypothetical protein
MVKGVKIFGKKLAQLRESVGLTQEELALRAEMSKGRISGLESAEIGGMYRRNLRRLGEALGLSSEELLSRIGAPPGATAGANGSSPRPSPTDILATLEYIARAHPAIRLVDALALVKDNRAGMPLREAAMPIPKGGMNIPGGKRRDKGE